MEEFLIARAGDRGVRDTIFIKNLMEQQKKITFDLLSNASDSLAHAVSHLTDEKDKSHAR